MPGQGLIRVGQRGGEVLLALTPASAGNALDSGLQMIEAIGLKTIMFQLVGPGAATAGYSVTAFGTIDPAAYDLAWGFAGDPNTNRPAVKAVGKGATGLPTTSWVVLPGPAEQAGTGVMGNPMVTGQSPILKVDLPLVAVRVVAVIGNAPAPTQPISVLCFAVP